MGAAEFTMPRLSLCRFTAVSMMVPERRVASTRSVPENPCCIGQPLIQHIVGIFVYVVDGIVVVPFRVVCLGEVVTDEYNTGCISQQEVRGRYLN